MAPKLVDFVAIFFFQKKVFLELPFCFSGSKIMITKKLTFKTRGQDFLSRVKLASMLLIFYESVGAMQISSLAQVKLL